MAMDQKIITNSPQETEEFAAEFAKKLKPGDIVALTGDLGGGKTTFTRGLARGLGIKKQVVSPTFMLERILPVPGAGPVKYLRHYDAYRLTSGADLIDIGFGEVAESQNSVVVVEWADRVREVLPENTIWVKFEFVRDQERSLEITLPGNKS